MIYGFKYTRIIFKTKKLIKIMNFFQSKLTQPENLLMLKNVNTRIISGNRD